MSNRGRWDNWYAGLTVDDPQPYGQSDSYRILADWMEGCDTVEDWGCGKGWMRTLFDGSESRYVGIDGSHTPFADIITDLRHYRSNADGIIIRHVLEHDYHWEMILTNAVASFRRRLAIALFTPMQDDETRQIDHTPLVDVPDIGFYPADIESAFGPHHWTRIDLTDSPTKYKVETIYLVSKEAAL